MGLWWWWCWCCPGRCPLRWWRIKSGNKHSSYWSARTSKSLSRDNDDKGSSHKTGRKMMKQMLMFFWNTFISRQWNVFRTNMFDHGSFVFYKCVISLILNPIIVFCIRKLALFSSHIKMMICKLKAFDKFIMTHIIIIDTKCKILLWKFSVDSHR